MISLIATAWLARGAHRPGRADRTEGRARTDGRFFARSDGHLDKSKGRSALGIAFDICWSGDYPMVLSDPFRDRLGHHHIRDLWSLRMALLDGSRASAIPPFPRGERSRLRHSFRWAGGLDDEQVFLGKPPFERRAASVTVGSNRLFATLYSSDRCREMDQLCKPRCLRIADLGGWCSMVGR